MKTQTLTIMVIDLVGSTPLVAQASRQQLLEMLEDVTIPIGQPTLPSGVRLEGCRVVMHTSDVLMQDNDVLGEGVVTVARLEKHVPTNEVYLTSTTRDVAKSSEFEFQLIGD